MSRITVHHDRRAPRSRRPGSAPGVALAGLAGLSLGVFAGFLLGEVAGPAAERTLRGGHVEPPTRSDVAALVAQARRALDGDLLLRDCHVHVVPVGPGRIELRGWVPDRRSRTRAAQLVTASVHADALINCLLVHGEDDQAPETATPAPDELLA